VAPGDDSAIGRMVVDSSTRMGFVIDHTHDTVEVYDTSGDAFVLRSTLLVDAIEIAVDQVGDRLYIGHASGGLIDVVDADPASATAFTVLRTVNAGFTPQVLAAGVGDDVVVGEVTQTELRIVDAAEGTSVVVRLRSGASDLAVDTATGTIYAASFADRSVTVRTADGMTRRLPLADQPRHIALGIGTLYAALEGASGATLVAVRIADGKAAAAPAVLPVRATDMAVDSRRGRVITAAGLSIFDAATLAPAADVTGPLLLGVSLDAATGRVFTSDANSPRPSRVSMLEIDEVPPKGVDRLGGADRYAVSAAVSADTFSPGVPVAYVASGAAFPDALSGSAAAGAHGAPVLLVTRDSVPSVVASELDRLDPARVVVLGGLSSIGAGVETSLAAYAPLVERLGGADRYEVSVAVSTSEFESDTVAPVVYVAAGAVFPDALSGSAAAGATMGRVLLTRQDAVPPAVAAELRRLQPGRIVLLGGASTVSAGVEAALSSIAPTTRIAGTDRYDVSSAVSASAFSADVRTVYVASGAVFPDALSGSAAAIANNAPVLLVKAGSIPPSVQAELRRITPTRIVVLGGPATVADSVADALEGYLAP
jgi:putative cell wall-binding protein